MSSAILYTSWSLLLYMIAFWNMSKISRWNCSVVRMLPFSIPFLILVRSVLLCMMSQYPGAMSLVTAWRNMLAYLGDKKEEWYNINKAPYQVEIAHCVKFSDVFSLQKFKAWKKKKKKYSDGPALCLKHFYMGYGICHYDSTKRKVILQWISIKYAIYHMKMQHVRNCALSVMSLQPQVILTSGGWYFWNFAWRFM